MSRYFSPGMRSNVPTAIRAAARSRRASVADEPAWMLDPESLNKILGAYDLYVQHKPLRDIAMAYGVHPSTVQKWLRKARVIAVEMFREDLHTIVVDQINARRKIVAEAYRTLEELRVSPLSAERSRVEAQILVSISREERQIEELLALRGASSITPNASPTDPASIESGRTYMLDAETLQVIEDTE